jgi:ABC-type molybdate transport system permease subunit
MIAIILLGMHIILGKIMGGGMIIDRTRVFAFKIYFKLKKVSLKITHILLKNIMLMRVIMIGGARMLEEMRELRKIEENNIRE